MSAGRRVGWHGADIWMGVRPPLGPAVVYRHPQNSAPFHLQRRAPTHLASMPIGKYPPYSVRFVRAELHPNLLEAA